MTHYERLGVRKEATQAELKTAYRELVKKHHPDINPSPSSKQLMQEINEAYEVLSDHFARNLYDAQLNGVFVAKPPEETPAEKYRREYRRKKAHEERENLEYLVKLKIKFYKYERKVCWFFLVFGLICTLDYYFQGDVKTFEIKEVRGNNRNSGIVFKNFKKALVTDIGLAQEYRKTRSKRVHILFSSVFKVPSEVRLEGSNKKYLIHGTLHSYHNFFSVIILGFSIIVLRNKEYNDFRLTCGLVPLLLIVFLSLFIVSTPSF